MYKNLENLRNVVRCNQEDVAGFCNLSTDIFDKPGLNVIDLSNRDALRQMGGTRKVV